MKSTLSSYIGEIISEISRLERSEMKGRSTSNISLEFSDLVRDLGVTSDFGNFEPLSSAELDELSVLIDLAGALDHAQSSGLTYAYDRVGGRSAPTEALRAEIRDRAKALYDAAMQRARRTLKDPGLGHRKR